MSTQEHPTTGAISAPELTGMPGIRHAFFTRKGGVSKGIFSSLNAGLGSGDDRESVQENRHRMTDHLGVQRSCLATPYQVHSATAVTASRAWTNDRPQADGVVTNTPGLAIGVVTADCGPVLFADADAGVIGAAHAGWKGALTGILEDTIAKMERLGASRKKITAVLGPSIGQFSYEVGPSFPDSFTEQEPSNACFFSASSKPGHHMFDLPGYIVRRLTEAGVQAAATGHCTYALDDAFFSYRRTTHRNESDYGRQMSAIVLE